MFDEWNQLAAHLSFALGSLCLYSVVLRPSVDELCCSSLKKKILYSRQPLPLDTVHILTGCGRLRDWLTNGGHHGGNYGGRSSNRTVCVWRYFDRNKQRYTCGIIGNWEGILVTPFVPRINGLVEESGAMI